MTKFIDRGNDIVIVTDAIEESVSKKDFVATDETTYLLVYGQKLSPQAFLLADIEYPVFATIAELIAELNTWALGYDFHAAGVAPATVEEVNAGVVDDKAVTPFNLRQSNYGTMLILTKNQHFR